MAEWLGLSDVAIAPRGDLAEPLNVSIKHLSG
jgi:hypothetical protein